MWYEEFKETFEFVKCDATLSLMPMEVRNLGFRSFSWRIHIDFSFTVTSTNFFVP
jgi:hypothetical protein